MDGMGMCPISKFHHKTGPKAPGVTQPCFGKLCDLGAELVCQLFDKVSLPLKTSFRCLPHGRSCSIGMRMAIWDIENEEEKVALKDGANGRKP